MISVSNIERFAVHDGPGIRTTVFLNGCPLHCPWCANPETWTISPKLMHDEKKCVGCQTCRHVCSQQAISFEPDFHVNRQLCKTCGTCVDACIPEALSISGQWMDIDQILEEVKKDQRYYDNSNGGVTLSGGEPLYQFEQVLPLLKRFHQEQLHVALETTGNYPLEHLKQAEPYVDLFLMDCKHLDQDTLKKVTGADLNQIQENFTYLSRHCPEKVIVRMPVIWDFNTDQIEQTIDFSAKMGFPEIDLLPYHSLGKNKWQNLQKTYVYEKYAMMEKEDLQVYVKYGMERGIKVKLGG